MNFTRRLIYCIIFLLKAGNTSAQFSRIFLLPFPKQYAAVDSLINCFDVTKPVIYDPHFVEAMHEAAYKTGDPLTIINFKRALLSYKYVCSGSDTSLARYLPFLQEINDLLGETDEQKYPEVHAMLYVNTGNIYYYKLKHFQQAFEYYLKAYYIFKNVPIERFPDRQYSQYAIALAYYQFGDYNNAIRLGKEIDALYPSKNYISVYNIDMIGMSYLKTKQYDSALAQFQWILDHIDIANNPEAWKGIIAGNIGQVYYLQNNYDKALYYFEPAIEITMAQQVPDNTADFAAYTSTIYLKKNNIPFAKKYAEIAQQSAYKANTAGNYYNVYKTLTAFYKQTGDNGRALLYSDSANIFKDSLASLNNVNLKYKAEMIVETERKKQQEKLFEDEKSRQVLIRNGLIVLIVLVMVITLLIYNRNRLKNKHREQQLMTEKQMAESELLSAESQLKDFTKSIIEKNELLEKASREIEQLNDAYKELKDQRPGTLTTINGDDSFKQLQQSVLLTDDDWKNFSRLFDKVYPGFFTRLKEKSPGLSPAETRFAALSKLKLNNKEMAAMLGVGTDAIRQGRSRFRKKFNLHEEASVEDEIDKI